MKNNKIYVDLEREYLFNDILAQETKYLTEQYIRQEINKISTESDFEEQTKIEIGDVRINNTEELIFDKKDDRRVKY